MDNRLTPWEKVTAAGMAVAILAMLGWFIFAALVALGAAAAAGPLGVVAVLAVAWFVIANNRRDREQGVKRY